MKRFKIIILEKAIEDLDKSFEWYNEINSELANKFLAAVNNSVNDLKKNPFYQIRYDDFRMKIVKKFPFIIHYTVDMENLTVSIYGIRNSYRNPDDYPSKSDFNQ